MLTGPISPAFVAYGIAAIVLCLNLMILWGMSGGARAGSKTAPNPEDAATFKAELSAADPPRVARILRAHANGQATIYPFLILGLVLVLIGGNYTAAVWIFGVFVVARILHSIFYLAGMQPWRTISFAVSGITLLALIVQLALRLWAVSHGG